MAFWPAWNLYLVYIPPSFLCSSIFSSEPPITSPWVRIPVITQTAKASHQRSIFHRCRSEIHCYLSALSAYDSNSQAHGIPGTHFTDIRSWISNYILHNVWDEITYSFPNFNDCTAEVWEWICNFTPQFTGHMTYLELKLTHLDRRRPSEKLG